MTRRAEIRDEILARLNTNRPTDVPEFTKRRFDPGALLVGKRNAVYFLQQNNQSVGSRAGKRRELIIAIEVAGAFENADDADDYIEPSLEWSVSVLTHANLAPLATAVEEEGTEWASQSSDLFRIVAVQKWRVEFLTARDAT